MLDLQFIRENPDIVRAAMKNKNKEGVVDLDRLLQLADDRKKLAGDIGDINRKRNEAQQARDGEAGKRLKDELKMVEDKYAETEKELVSLMVQIPNIPSADTPIGPGEEDNQVLREWGDKPQFGFTPRAHWDLGRELGLIDNEKASEISGARFTFLKGDLALLQFALVQFAMKVLTSRETLEDIVKGAGLSVDPKPFVPVIPPVMMRPQVMNRMARLEPREERYVFDEDTVLVGSAEHTLGPLHMDEVIAQERLPIRYVGYSTAFRREAGAAGKDTRGILRLHQFDKVEMETFTLPEDSLAEQDFLVAIQEHLMRELKVPYRVVICSTGDQGDADARHIDLECWMPGQDTYRETHSADLMQGYQARRLNTRVKRTDGAVETVHMNDATAYAVGRTLIAIMENYQQADGSIAVPEVLRPYMSDREKLEKVTI
ncbi:MAG TPA: serine--tRNA ligase [Candidatus Paceibacterota bacterium]|jgi:seryl-tRNA synthetase|nr:serine--tRNA ligase [Candidatus Paceibacterota bacterium]